MQPSARVLLTCLTLGILLTGCTNNVYHRNADRGTLIEATPASSRPVFKIVVALTYAPATQFGRQLGDFYVRSLSDEILKKDDQLQLISIKEAGYSDLLRALPQPAAQSAVLQKLAEQIRREGFQALLTAGVLDVHADARRTGIFWFRKMRYFLSFDIILDVYDPFTAAKLISRLKEETIQIELEDYESLQNGTLTSSDAVNEAVAETAEEFAEQVAETFENTPWKTSVTALIEDRILLSGGRRTGLEVGDRLGVYKGRRVIDGKGNEKFIVPGYEIGDVRITAISDQNAEAKADGRLEIEAGDIAVFNN